MRIIDLSLPLQNDPGQAPVIHYTDHQTAALRRAEELHFNPASLPTPMVDLATERYEVATHRAATHVDAPWHYGPTSEGRPARTIDELPLEWFLSRGIVLNCERFMPGEMITVEFASAELERIGLQTRDIVLVRTGADRLWGQSSYEGNNPFLSAGAVEWMLDRGVKIIGIDTYSPDPPIRKSLDLLKHGRSEDFLPVHMIGRRREFCIMEKLGQLDQLPPTGFQVACFPIKVERGSGGWSRAVAILPD